MIAPFIGRGAGEQCKKGRGEKCASSSSPLISPTRRAKAKIYLRGGREFGRERLFVSNRATKKAVGWKGKKGD